MHSRLRQNTIPASRSSRRCSQFFQTPPPSAPNEVNVGVTLSANFPGLFKTAGSTKHIYNNSSLETLAARTDAPHFQMLDPQTLEPIGLAKQEILHPELKGVGSGAHAEHDPATGDIFNYNLVSLLVNLYRVCQIMVPSILKP